MIAVQLLIFSSVDAPSLPAHQVVLLRGLRERWRGSEQHRRCQRRSENKVSHSPDHFVLAARAQLAANLLSA